MIFPRDYANRSIAVLQTEDYGRSRRYKLRLRVCKRRCPAKVCTSLFLLDINDKLQIIVIHCYENKSTSDSIYRLCYYLLLLSKDLGLGQILFGLI